MAPKNRIRIALLMTRNSLSNSLCAQKLDYLKIKRKLYRNLLPNQKKEKKSYMYAKQD